MNPGRNSFPLTELANRGHPDVEEPKFPKCLLADLCRTFPDATNRVWVQRLSRGNLVNNRLGLGQNFGGNSDFSSFHKCIIDGLLWPVKAKEKSIPWSRNRFADYNLIF